MMKRNLISSQYLRPDKISISIIEMKNPAHYIVKEYPSIEASSEVVKFIEVEEIMQKYYGSVEPSLYQLPLKDDIVVVKADKKYYRAMVCSILNKTDGYVFKVYLVDYGKLCSVPRSCLYEISRDFLLHPFQTVEFKLLDIEPASLIMNSTDMTFSYGKVESWDPSAVSYIEMIQKALNQAYIVVKGVEKNCLVGSLIVTLCDGEVKCVNDELIARKFARSSPDGMENVMTLKTYIQNQFLLPSTNKIQLVVGSSSESVISVCSIADETKDAKDKPVKEPEKANFHSKETMRRKMIDRIAVDVDEIQRTNKEWSSKAVQNKESNASSKLKNLLKYRSINSSTSSVHSNSSSENQYSPKSTISCRSAIKEEGLRSLKPDKVINSKEKSGLSSSENLSIARQNILNENDMTPLLTTSSPQTSPIKVEDIKKFLHTRKKTLSAKIKPCTEVTISPKSDLFPKESSDTSSSNSDARMKLELKKVDLPKETNSENNDPLENLIKEVMSDIDDPDDLLQCALDPDNKKSSSETDTARYVRK